MKKAAIVVGKPNAGKSTTIRCFKGMVTIETYHIFTLNGKRGYILLSSFEEGKRDIQSTIKKLLNYDLLVFACQGLKLTEVHDALKAASFAFKDVTIKSPSEAPAKALEVLKFLS